MIAGLIAQLVTALKDDSIGFQGEVATVAAANSVSLPSTPDASIYGLDKPLSTDYVNAPLLALAPATTDTGEVRSQSRRDSVHTVGFEWYTDAPDENVWRQQSVYAAEALMRFLDNFNANNSNYVGSSGAIVVQGWSVDYTLTWDTPNNTLHGFAMTADILARDTF